MTTVERFCSFIEADWPEENILEWMKTLTDEQRQEIQDYSFHIARLAMSRIGLSEPKEGLTQT